MGREIAKAFMQGDLPRASALARDGVGGQQNVSAKLRKLVAEIHYAQCRRAFLRKEWPEAVRTCEAANREISHAKATQILSGLSARARKLFLEGYVMEKVNPEGAQKRYRESLSCAPSKSVYREKARHKLKQIEAAKAD